MSNESETRKVIPFERTKVGIESVKHMTTLATGVIAVIGALLDKLPKPLVGFDFLIESVACMIACVLVSAIYLYAAGIVPSVLSEEEQADKERPERPRMRLQMLGLLVFTTFATGVMFFGLFGIRNLWNLK